MSDTSAVYLGKRKVHEIIMFQEEQNDLEPACVGRILA
jgi:hypothetical protein